MKKRERTRVYMAYFFKGILIGLVFGVPVGAVGALTVRRTIAYGRAAGFFSGLGCSAADLCYCGVSVFGFTLISDFMLSYQKIISLLGGLFIVLMGIGFIKQKQPVRYENRAVLKWFSFFGSSFIIAAGNPATIVTFLLAFSVFNMGEIHSVYDGIGTVFGVLLGTCVWWTLMSLVLGSVRKHITQRKGIIINYILGILVLLFGVMVIAKAFYSF